MLAGSSSARPAFSEAASGMARMPTRMPTKPPARLSSAASSRNCSTTSCWRAHCHAHADLPRSLRHADQHHVHDAEAADDQRHDSQRSQQHGEGAGRILLDAQNVLLGGQPEVVKPLAVVPLLDAMPQPQMRRNLGLGFVHARLIGHTRSDLDPRIVLEEVLHRSADGQVEGLVWFRACAPARPPSPTRRSRRSPHTACG